MKTAVTLITLLLVSTFAIGQTIPNNSFETWGPGAFPGTESVTGWIDAGVGGLTKVGSPQNGSFAVSLKPIILVGSPFPGILAGKFATAGVRSQYLNGYFKRPAGANIDTLIIAAFYSLGQDDTNFISFGAQYTRRSASNWTAFSIPLYVARPSVLPDSFQIVIYAPESNVSAYLVDNVSFGNTALGPGLGEDYFVSNKRLLKSKKSTLSVSLYPVPAKGLLNVVIAKPNTLAGQLEVLDLSGRVLVVERRRAITGGIPMNIEGLNPGIYLLKTTVGTSVSVKKFVVSK